LFDDIIKDVKNNISDHFLYLVMHDDYCTHKYKKGKNEGKYCAKKIRSNNPKKVYLCCQHDKNHIPQKKKNKNKNKNINEVIEIKNNNINIDEAIEIKNNFENKYNDEGYETNNGITIDIGKKIEKNKINHKKEIIKLNKGKIIITNINENKINNCNDITNNNDDYFKKIDKNIKYIKKRKWKKLDILQDTGFVFL
jgi:hypothetical protein